MDYRTDSVKMGKDCTMDFKEMDVTPEVVQPETEADYEGEQPGQEETADQRVSPDPAQSPEENALYADMRRKQELETARQQLCTEKQRGERLAVALGRIGYSGSVEEIADRLEAEKRQIHPEQVKSEREELTKASDTISALEQENIALKQKEARRTFAADLAEIQKLDKGVKALQDLGNDFFKMRAAGVSNLVAYNAVRSANPKPPSTGDLNTTTTKEKDFFTKEEVVAMSPAEVEKHLDTIRKSQSKWR